MAHEAEAAHGSCKKPGRLAIREVTPGMMRLPILLRRAVSCLPVTLLPLAVAGCPGRTNIVTVTQHLQIQPVAGDTYSGYTGTTFGEAVDPGKKIYLRDAKLTSSSGEFSWISSMSGTAENDGGTKELISKGSFADAKGGTVELDIDDKGDLHSLYPDGQNFRVYWDWAFTTSPAQSYPNGIELTFTYTLDIE